MIDSDVDDESGGHTDEFYRGIQHMNLVLGSTNPQATGIHWAESQATHIRDVYIDATGAAAGIFGENGSGGFIGDLVVVGGRIGISFGNQQWTWRNITVSGSETACIQFLWNWAMILENVQLSNCPLGIMFTGTATGSISVLDSTFTNVALGISTDFPNPMPGLLLERFTAVNVPIITTNLPGVTDGIFTIDAWYQGNYFGQGGALQPGSQGSIPLTRPNTPLEQRSRPTFDGYDFINVYSTGAYGDGIHDDTVAVQTALNLGQAVFFPQGTYLISATLNVSANQILVGEALSAIAAVGGVPAWSDPNNPVPMLNIPAGATVQLAELLFTSTGNSPGCLLVSWGGSPSSGAWDVHWREYYTNYGLLSITGGGYFENMWAWTADHDINSGATITVVNPRGITVNGADSVWFYGVAAEHSYMWQFNITSSNTVYVLMAQTETPYWQNPPTAWAMVIDSCTDTHVYGTGFYNWFFGIQEEVFLVQNSSTAVLFDVNTYNVSQVLSGDITIEASNPAVDNWFTKYFMVLIPSTTEEQ